MNLSVGLVGMMTTDKNGALSIFIMNCVYITYAILVVRLSSTRVCLHGFSGCGKGSNFESSILHKSALGESS
jgi:hypothetical protein